MPAPHIIQWRQALGRNKSSAPQTIMPIARTSNVRKIAILGGGISSLSAVFDLTSERNWKDKYEITIYQLGWRLGGKGASSRNPEYSNRIEEHGLHVWLGFYENAFAMIRQCYEECGSQGGTFPAWDKAFKPHDYIVLEDKAAREWMHWPVSVPFNESLPGDGRELPTLWDYVVMALQWIRDLLEPHQLISNERSERATVSSQSSVAMTEELSRKERTNPRLGLKLIRTAERKARRMPRNSRRHKPRDRDSLASLLVDFSKLTGNSLPEGVETDPERRRIWLTVDLFAAAIRGILHDHVLDKGLDQLDDMDFRDWLRKHEAAEVTVDSALIRAAYDLAFSFENGDPTKMNLAAGVAVRAMFRMVFTYKGALTWKMQAGMGETVFTPIYLVLKNRGVKFCFFSRVDSLKLSDDRTAIAKIELTRQATCNHGDYEPLIRVGDLDCWHHGPDFTQLVEGEKLKTDSINLESYWTPWTGVQKVTLENGKDFDTIILGIPIAALKPICSNLIEASPRWSSMVERVKSIQTQGFQLWLNKDLVQCGWQLQSPIVCAYVEPLDTWADMSHLLAIEGWSDITRPKQLAYFCGVMESADQIPSEDQTGFPAAEAARCKAQAIEFLNRNSSHLWPKTAGTEDPNAFEWSYLASASDQQGPSRFDSQYWRANIDPSERYVLALAGSTQYRLRSGESGFSNLILAGDWIRNGFNSPGCIESAVISGRQAAREISGSKVKIIGENDFNGRQGVTGWLLETTQDVIDLIRLAIDRWGH